MLNLLLHMLLYILQLLLYSLCFLLLLSCLLYLHLKDKQIEIAYTISGQSDTVRLNTLHSGIPDIVAEGKGVIPGDFYLSFVFQRLIMKYDNNGQILYYRYDPTPDVSTFKELGYWDFKKHVFEEKINDYCE